MDSAGSSSHKSKPQPSILIVGSPDVGKRSIFSRLACLDPENITNGSSGVNCHRWTIDTKYYTAEVCIWLAHLCEKSAESAQTLAQQCDALVMVIDLNNLTSFEILKEWTSGVDLRKFEILLCVGNKADLLPGHFAHAQYRRFLERHEESSCDPHPEFLDYGIDQDEGRSLLNDAEEPSEVQRLCLDWCRQNDIEYVESCAVNDTFDNCLSVDGDFQGIKRIREAVSAHIWPGMVMKSPQKLPEAPVSQEKEDFSDVDSVYDIEYELLSNGSVEPLDDLGDSWVTVSESGLNIQSSENMDTASTRHVGLDDKAASGTGNIGTHHSQSDSSPDEKSKETSMVDQVEKKVEETPCASSMVDQEEKSEHNECVDTKERDFAMENLEQLMHEMAYVRENLRLMPDSHRREIAAKLAMQMASMFADDKADDESD